MERLIATNVFFELLILTVRVLVSHVSGLGDGLGNMHLYFELYRQSKQDRPTRFLRACCGLQKFRCFPKHCPEREEYTAAGFK